MFDSYNMTRDIITGYIDERKNCRSIDSGMESEYTVMLERDMDRMLREIKSLVKAVNTLERYGIKVG